MYVAYLGMYKLLIPFAGGSLEGGGRWGRGGALYVRMNPGWI